MNIRVKETHFELIQEARADLVILSRRELFLQQAHEVNEPCTRSMQVCGLTEVPALSHVGSKLVPVLAHSLDGEKDLKPTTTRVNSWENSLNFFL